MGDGGFESVVAVVVGGMRRGAWEGGMVPGRLGGRVGGTERGTEESEEEWRTVDGKRGGEREIYLKAGGRA